MMGVCEVKNMSERDIEKINKWFDEHTEYYGTYQANGEYSLGDLDIEAFGDFLSREFPDLMGFRCYFGIGNSHIWFYKQDLKKATFY